MHNVNYTEAITSIKISNMIQYDAFAVLKPGLKSYVTLQIISVTVSFFFFTQSVDKIQMVQ